VQSELEVFEEFVKNAFHEPRQQKLKELLKEEGDCDLHYAQSKVLMFLEVFKHECLTGKPHCESADGSVIVGMEELERQFSSGELANSFADEEYHIPRDPRETLNVNWIPPSIPINGAAWDESKTITTSNFPVTDTDTLNTDMSFNIQADDGHILDGQLTAIDLMEPCTIPGRNISTDNIPQTIQPCYQVSTTNCSGIKNKGKSRIEDEQALRDFVHDELSVRNEDDWQQFIQSTFEDDNWQTLWPSYVLMENT
jgi:hypothetical protein